MKTSALISTDQALQLINEKNAVVLDATIDKVNQKIDNTNLELIPNSLFFDIEGKLSDHQSGLPHTMPSAADFQKEMQSLGVNQNDVLIIYDRWGVYSSPRAWWMLKYMGADQVFVLNGGLPAWKAAGLPLAKTHLSPAETGNFMANPQPEWYIDKNNLIQSLGKPEMQITDARSTGRFHGTAPEPRAGLRSGHIPGSKNIPFEEVLNGISYKDQQELEIIYQDKLHKNKRQIFSCGSGISASIIALAAYQLGYDQITIYDGSWAEWGADPIAPIEKP